MDEPGLGVPDADRRVETARDDPKAVKGDGVDLMLVTTENEKTLPCIDIP